LQQIQTLDSGTQSGVSFTLNSSGSLSVGNMTVGSSSATSLQALKLIAATGTLSVFSATVVQAVEGTVSLQNTDATDGVINIGIGATVGATTTDSRNVEVFIYRGTSANLEAGTEPGTVAAAVVSPGFIDWGTPDSGGNSITANDTTPITQVNALGRPVVFDAKGDSSKIVLEGSNKIVAQSN
jgi:hypothetical protein